VLDANGARTWLAGGDIYLKYMPPNHSASYFALAVQSEYFWRRTAGAADGTSEAHSDGGFYTQLVLQAARRWHAGVRYDRLGVPSSTVQPDIDRVTAMVAFTPSEFSRLRLQGDREKPSAEGAIYEALLLLEFSIGAHGAHSF
jgi:hypothetical protein